MHDLQKTTPRRRRAKSMPPEARRAQLVEATIPLLLGRAHALTTAEVARAAGVAEGTLFRAFEDKASLLDACLAHALDPAAAQVALRDVSHTGPVDDVLVAVVDVLIDHLKRALPVMHAVLHDGEQRPLRGQIIGGMFHTVLSALAALFARYIESRALRGEAITLARVLLGLCQSTVWQHVFDGAPTLASRELVRLFLDGCRAD